VNNTVENAKAFYLNTLPDSRYKNTLLELTEQGFVDTAKVKMNLIELCEVMNNYHNAIIQSKIEKLEKAIEFINNIPYIDFETFEKNNRAMWDLKIIKNYLKEM
jgi:hypothetical protein